MEDVEVDRAFTRQQLDQMKAIRKDVRLSDHIMGDGSEVVVDVLDGGRCWIQRNKLDGTYRCAEKTREAAPYERGWRRPSA